MFKLPIFQILKKIFISQMLCYSNIEKDIEKQEQDNTEKYI